MVEAMGVEPMSESLSSAISTCVYGAQFSLCHERRQNPAELSFFSVTVIKNNSQFTFTAL